MAELIIEITRFVDPYQPGWVECRLLDPWGVEWIFTQKQVTVSETWLDEDSTYPRPGCIACQVVKTWQDDAGRSLVRVDTSEPESIASDCGESQFDVLASQVTGV